MGHKKFTLINREISWLSFNERVLQEAEDPAVPLLDRLRFLGIFSNNRDEFFRVRVATLRRMVNLGSKAKHIIGENPEKVLEKIHRINLDQERKFVNIYEKLLLELHEQHIHIINEKQLTEPQQHYVQEYFRTTVLPALTPIMLDPHSKKFPALRDPSAYLIVRLVSESGNKKTRHAIIEIPTNHLSRFLIIPDGGNEKYVILLEDIIRFNLDEIFSIFEYEYSEAYTFKLTRDAELDIDNDLSKSLIEKVTRSLKKRKKGNPVRFIYDHAMPKETLGFLFSRLRIKKTDNVTPAGRYHNFKDFMHFPDFGRSDLKNDYPEPLQHKELTHKRSILKVIRSKDVLLFFPYHTFNHILDVLREASVDPKVESIRITLYRLARNSNLINILINAVRNGKSVTACVELQARFDEEANIYWANKLTEEGVRVIYGVPGLKVHSKLFLIKRREGGKTISYAHIGTGNFNENTAKVYSDISLLTSDKRITEEVESMFEFYDDNLQHGKYRHSLVSPFFMKTRIIGMINNEIENKRKGLPAYITMKLNSVLDIDIIARLYKASREGVKVKMIVRSICALVTEHEDLSKNIEVISIVDKYLEHARVLVFCNNGDEKYYISSGDMMTRNLEFRSEIAVPIFDKGLKTQLKKFLDIQWNDTVKARIINRKQDNLERRNPGKPKLRSQDEIHSYLKSL